MKMIKNKSTMLLAGLAALLLSVAAQAGTIEYTKYDLKYGYGPYGIVTTTTPKYTTPRPVYAGEFKFTTSSGTFDGFCIDLTTNINATGKYNIYSGDHSFTSLQLNALGLLFENHYADAGMTKNESAAFQLAIWNIVYGKIDFSTSFSSAVGNLFEEYVGTVKGGGSINGTYTFHVYDQAGNQNMLTWTKVPEPGTLALLGLGLLGAGAMRRRRI